VAHCTRKDVALLFLPAIGRPLNWVDSYFDILYAKTKKHNTSAGTKKRFSPAI